MFDTNLLAGLIQQPCGAQHRGAAGFLAEFGTAIEYIACVAEVGWKPLAALLTNDCTPHAPNMVCGLVQSSLREWPRQALRHVIRPVAHHAVLPVLAMTD